MPSTRSEACPPEEQIERWLAVGSSGTGSDIGSHVEHCIGCRSRAERLRANNVLLREFAQLGEVGSSGQRPRAQDGSSGSAEAIDDAEPGWSDSSGAARLPPHSFAGYELLREVHRGGQGVVYLAIQKSTRRKVALKVMKEGPFAGPADRARFEREVQVLGQLQHPNIITIHDSGSAAGHFYFVMDYIAGQPLDAYMAGATESHEGTKTRRHKGNDTAQPGLSIESTLKLFATICEAVNAAHLRGIIHRDLKPSNIRIDETGQPHILDFGLAKVALPEISNLKSEVGNLVTITGQFVGSLPWASPEQAEGSQWKIDLRTDVYSLGVILYQMLTAKFPYDVGGPMREVLERIIHADPVRPRNVRRRVDDEVETIVLKCLQKDRDRRYQTAGELARDVRHYLAGEPIEARRDSIAYMLGKQLRRYRLAGVIAGSFLTVLLAGLVISVAAWRQSAVAWKEEERQRIKAQESETSANASKAEAQDEAARARKILSLLNEMLVGGEVRAGPAAPDSFRAQLDTFAAGLHKKLRDQPEIEATVRTTLGHTYASLALPAAALEQFRTALGLHRKTRAECDPAVNAALLDLVHTLRRWQYLDEMEAVAREALQIVTAEGADDESLCLADRNYLLALALFDRDRVSAEPYGRRALETRRKLLGDRHADTAESLTFQAYLYWRERRYPEAIELYRAGVEAHRQVFGEFHPKTLDHTGGLARTLAASGDLTAARTLVEEVGQRVEARFGAEHRLMAENYWFLSDILAGTAPAEALAYAERARDLSERVLGLKSFHAISSQLQVARLQHRLKRYDEAEAGWRTALANSRAVLGEAHDQTVQCVQDLARFLRNVRHRPDLSIEFYRDAIARAQRELGPDHPELGRRKRMLIRFSSWLPAGSLAQYEPDAREAVAITRRQYGENHSETATALSYLADALRDAGKLAEAESVRRQACEVLETVATKSQHEGVIHPKGSALRTLASHLDFLAVVILEQGDRLEEAERIWREAEELFRDVAPDRLDRLGLISYELAHIRRLVGDRPEAQRLEREAESAFKKAGIPGTWSVNQQQRLVRVSALLLRDGEYARAVPLLRTCVKKRRKFVPDHWWRYEAESLLGEALAGMSPGDAKRIGEAESLLLSAHAGLTKAIDAPPELQSANTRRIVNLYRCWDAAEPGKGYAEKAAEWQATLECTPTTQNAPTR